MQPGDANASVATSPEHAMTPHAQQPVHTVRSAPLPTIS